MSKFIFFIHLKRKQQVSSPKLRRDPQGFLNGLHTSVQAGSSQI